MSISRKRRLLVAGLLLALVLLVVWVLSRDQAHRPVSVREATRNPGEDTSAVLPDTGVGDLPPDGLHALELPPSFVETATASGYPLMSNPRKWIFARTQAQTIEETAADMGNGWAVVLLTCTSDTIWPAGAMGYYAEFISRHMSILRLIGEGRRQPDYVSKLMHDVIADCMAEYETMRPKYEESLRQDWPGMSDHDPYYDANFRYEHPGWEFQRMHVAVYCAFYVLANIDRPAPGVLAQWLALDRSPRCASQEFEVWLINEFCQGNPLNTPEERHLGEILTSVEIPRQFVETSDWRSPVDVGDRLLAPMGVETSDVAKLRVLRLPHRPPRALSVTLQDEIIEAFVRCYAGPR